jgi:uncharacterized LabA/DUF88 family protein
MGIEELGWKLDFKRFNTYLKEKYSVKTTYLFIGYLLENQRLYTNLQKYGYELIFKPIIKDHSGRAKGNIDADLVLQVMINFDRYDKAVIVSSDGDFYSLVEYLYGEGKLKTVLSPGKEKCSILLRKKAKERIDFIENLRGKLEYTKGVGRG